MMWPGMMGGYGYGFGILGWLGMLFSWLVPVGLMVLGVYLVANWLRPARGNAVQEDPLTALKLRYARGEISDEEYRRIKGELLEK